MRKSEQTPKLAPSDEVKLMDMVQMQSNRDIDRLLPCDPCLDARDAGLDEPVEAEPIDIGLGIEDDLFNG